MDESFVSGLPSNLTEISTIAGPVAHGATALFRMHVVLTTVNDNGSSTASVTRPG